MEKTFLLPESTLGQVVGYLTTRPYREVAQLISLLAQAKPVPEALDDKVES